MKNKSLVWNLRWIRGEGKERKASDEASEVDVFSWCLMVDVFSCEKISVKSIERITSRRELPLIRVLSERIIAVVLLSLRIKQYFRCCSNLIKLRWPIVFFKRNQLDVLPTIISARFNMRKSFSGWHILLQKKSEGKFRCPWDFNEKF